MQRIRAIVVQGRLPSGRLEGRFGTARNWRAKPRATLRVRRRRHGTTARCNRRARTAAAAVAFVVSLAQSTGASTPEPPAKTSAERALEICDAAGNPPTAEARAELERGLSVAEEAVDADGRDPKAHLAVFCNLAKLTYLNGFSLRSLLAVWRLRREIDTALEIDPDYSDALLAKGSFLLNLPGFLGGDPNEAERLLRRAVELDPDWALARLYLAEALAAVGARDQAETQAHYALEIAERKGRTAQAEQARTLIARLRR
jgi:tetratricopeptide (TPR) repeat protein